MINPDSNTDTETLKHMNKSLWGCDICNQRFGTRNAFLQHKKKMHTQMETLIACDCCDLKFKTKWNLVLHKKRYRCKLCPVRFTKKKYLTIHIKLVHKNTERLFSCNICGKKFLVIAGLQRHLKTKNRKHTSSDMHKYRCSKCNLTFGDEILFRDHIQIHQKKVKKSKDRAQNINERLQSAISEDGKTIKDRTAVEDFDGKFSIFFIIKFTFIIEIPFRLFRVFIY